ncbi:MAG: hypothetical protein IIC90_07995 [Chloroflexi bacterium]|nr:hypothetical protein [Chloroflexota bacterium]
MSFDAFVADAERRLANHNASLTEEFRLALAELRPNLSETELRAWAEDGVTLAGEHRLVDVRRLRTDRWNCRSAALKVTSMGGCRVVKCMSLARGDVPVIDCDPAPGKLEVRQWQMHRTQRLWTRSGPSR